MWTSPRSWLRTVMVAACLVPLMPTVAHASSEVSAFDAVNQFIGTEMDTTQNKSNDAYGNTYPGASVPFGMVQPHPPRTAPPGSGRRAGTSTPAPRSAGSA